MNDKKSDIDFSVELDESDEVMLQALIASPAFGAMKRLIANYQKGCLSVLRTTSDTHLIFQTQGRLIGSSVLETLPNLIVQRKQMIEKKKAEAQAKEKEAQKRNAFAPKKFKPIL